MLRNILSINRINKKSTVVQEPVMSIASEISINNQPKKQMHYNNIAKAGKQKIMMHDSSNNEAITDINHQPANENIVLNIINDTNLIAAIMPIINKRKLKVVHINELGDPVEFPAEVAHNTDLHLFQLQLAQQETYNASSTAANNYSGISFKPKKISN